VLGDCKSSEIKQVLEKMETHSLVRYGDF